MPAQSHDPQSLARMVQEQGKTWRPGETSVSRLDERQKLLRLGARPTSVALASSRSTSPGGSRPAGKLRSLGADTAAGGAAGRATARVGVGHQHTPRGLGGALGSDGGPRQRPATATRARPQAVGGRAGASYTGNVIGQWSANYPNNVWFFDGNLWQWMMLDQTSESAVMLMNEVVSPARAHTLPLYHDTDDTTGMVVRPASPRGGRRGGHDPPRREPGDRLSLVGPRPRPERPAVPGERV